MIFPFSKKISYCVQIFFYPHPLTYFFYPQDPHPLTYFFYPQEYSMFPKEILYLVKSYLLPTFSVSKETYHTTCKKLLQYRSHKFRVLKKIQEFDSLKKSAIEQSKLPLSECTRFYLTNSDQGYYDCFWGFVVNWLKSMSAWHDFLVSTPSRSEFSSFAFVYLQGSIWLKEDVEVQEGKLVFWTSRCSLFAKQINFFYRLDHLTLEEISSLPKSLILPVVACIFDRAFNVERTRSWLTMEEKWELRQALQTFFSTKEPKLQMDFDNLCAVRKLQRMLD